MNLALVVVCVMLLLDRFRPVIELWVAFGVVMAVQVCIAVWMARQVAVREEEAAFFDDTGT